MKRTTKFRDEHYPLRKDMSEERVIEVMLAGGKYAYEHGDDEYRRLNCIHGSYVGATHALAYLCEFCVAEGLAV